MAVLSTCQPSCDSASLRRNRVDLTTRDSQGLFPIVNYPVTVPPSKGTAGLSPELRPSMDESTRLENYFRFALRKY